MLDLLEAVDMPGVGRELILVDPHLVLEGIAIEEHGAAAGLERRDALSDALEQEPALGDCQHGVVVEGAVAPQVAEGFRGQGGRAALAQRVQLGR